jgi:hypothetical protein
MHVIAVVPRVIQHHADRFAGRAEIQDTLDFIVFSQVQPANHRLDHRAEFAGNLVMIFGDSLGAETVLLPQFREANGNRIAGADERRFPGIAAPDHRAALGSPLLDLFKRIGLVQFAEFLDGFRIRAGTRRGGLAVAMRVNRRCRGRARDRIKR